MIYAEDVRDVMEGAYAAMESGDPSEKKAVVEKIDAVLEGVTEEYMHYEMLNNFRKALQS
jgi:hypothetical protein